jgi:charged multivesicular body protein 7
VVKIAQDETDEITEADIGTLTILSTIKTIDTQITSISAEITKNQLLAKTRLASGQKTLALSSLRSKKVLEEILSRRLSISEQLHKVLTSINTAQNDVGIMGAYETATKTLKGILAKPELDISRVEQTTEELAEVLASQEEVDSAIRVGGSVAVGAAGVGVNEDELEKELEGLVLDEKKAQEEAKEREVLRQREERERGEKEKAEREKEEERQREEKERKEREDKARAEREKKEKEVEADAAEKKWQDTYDAAQQRQREEAERAEIEQRRKDEKRIAAE